MAASREAAVGLRDRPDVASVGSSFLLPPGLARLLFFCLCRVNLSNGNSWEMFWKCKSAGVTLEAVSLFFASRRRRVTEASRAARKTTAMASTEVAKVAEDKVSGAETNPRAAKNGGGTRP